MRGEVHPKHPAKGFSADWKEEGLLTTKSEPLILRASRVRLLPWALVAGTFLEFLVLSIFRLPSAFEVSVVNPLGILTANLVFDDWWNVVIIAFAVCTVVFSVPHVAEGPRALTPAAFLVATNVSGVVASLVWLVSPFARSYYDPAKGLIVLPVDVGMSASAFGAASFALFLGVFVHVRLFRRYGKSAYRRTQLFWVLLYFSVVSSIFVGSALFYSPAILISHAAGIGSGLAMGYLATRWIGRSSRLSGLPLRLR